MLPVPLLLVAVADTALLLLFILPLPPLKDDEVDSIAEEALPPDKMPSLTFEEEVEEDVAFPPLPRFVVRVVV